MNRQPTFNGLSKLMGTTPYNLTVMLAGKSALLSSAIKRRMTKTEPTLIQVETKKPEPVVVKPISYSGDGETHICIDIDAQTDLGRMLSHYYECEFEHPVFGMFRTMEGFWRYINCDDKGTKQRDEFRTINGKGVNKISRTMEKRNVDNFKEIIYEANYYRILNNEKLYDLFVNSDLPFDYYFLFGDDKIVQRAKGYQWIINMYESLRSNMRKGIKPERPNYGELLDVLRSV